MSSPAISVLMPVYNAGVDCEGALLSLMEQSCEDFEVLVVDDGSTDDSLERIRSVADERVRILRQPHSGLTAALCHGLSNAAGEFVARQDADDRSLRERFQRQAECLRSNPDVVLVGTGVRVVDPKGRDLGQYSYSTEHEEIGHELLRLSNPLPHTTIMFRRQEVCACGGYRLAFRKAQEYDLYLRLAERHRLTSIAEPLCELRHSMNSVTASIGEGAQLEYAVMALVSAMIRRSGNPDPLSLPDSQPFQEDFRNWYRTSAYPRRFSSRLLRRSARLAWRDTSWALAASALVKAVVADPSWLATRMGFLSENHLAREASEWAQQQRRED